MKRHIRLDWPWQTPEQALGNTKKRKSHAMGFPLFHVVIPLGFKPKTFRTGI